jgi:hypothetical protein
MKCIALCLLRIIDCNFKSLNVFMYQDSVPKEKLSQLDPHVMARRTVLSNMPRIIASVSALWQAVMTGNEW